MMRRILLPFLIFLLSGCGQHFITDDAYRDKVKWDFDERAFNHLLPDELYLDTLDREYKEAMKFLYAYMPYSDLADYTPGYFLNEVEYAFMAREEMPWGSKVPEELFRHFVLVTRVNDESLDTARQYFYHQLKPVVEGMSMKEAVLEINHWCHARVDYRPSDVRTSSPLATLRTSSGGYDEESVFFVAALRSVGIPARQCYSPVWAHCYDRNTWVEAWIDGEWYYLAACEPEAALQVVGDVAVISACSMLVYTKAFGRYEGDEESVRRTPLFAELNLLDKYAKTRVVTAVAVTPDGKPVEGVHMKFKIYNNASFLTLADVVTDKNGEASFHTGCGDLLAWATDGQSQYGYAKISAQNNGKVEVCMNKSMDDSYMDQITLTPPAPDSIRIANPSETARQENKARIDSEDGQRYAYRATFVTEENLDRWVMTNENLTRAQALELMTLAEGNYAEVSQFLNAHTTYCEGLYLYEYMKSFSEKDLRDVPASVFEHHLTLYDGTMPEDVYKKGIMPARISTEKITEWRDIGEFVEPAVDDTGNYYHCPISPKGVERIKVADKQSRDIYYVATMRAHGTPAYLDPATETIYVYVGEAWCCVGSQEQANKKKVAINVSDKKYFYDYTIQKPVGGDFVAMDFENDEKMSASKPVALLTTGTYCLMNAERDAFGAVCVNLETFRVDNDMAVDMAAKGKMTILRVRMRLGAMGEDSKKLVQEMLANVGKYEKIKGKMIIEAANPDAPELKEFRKRFKVIDGRAVRGVKYPIVDIVLNNRPSMHYQGYTKNMFGSLLD